MCCVVTAQLQEMDMVRQKVFQLEQTQIAIKQKYVIYEHDQLSGFHRHEKCLYSLLISCQIRYDEDVARLHRELEARGGPPLSAHLSGPSQHSGPSQPPPPSIGHGPSNLFGGIMANPGGQGGPGLATPQEQPQQPPPAHQMPQPPPGPQSQGPSQLQQPSFPGYPQPSAINGTLTFPLPFHL